MSIKLCLIFKFKPSNIAMRKAEENYPLHWRALLRVKQYF